MNFLNLDSGKLDRYNPISALGPFDLHKWLILVCISLTIFIGIILTSSILHSPIQRSHAQTEQVVDQHIYLPIIFTKHPASQPVSTASSLSKPPTQNDQTTNIYLPLIIHNDAKTYGPAHCIQAISAGVLSAQAQSKVGGAISSDRDCIETFMEMLLDNPSRYLDDFYPLVVSSHTTDALWSIVYDKMRFNEFRFDSFAVESLQTELTAAVEQCTGGYRCKDWRTYILPNLQKGHMFGCPFGENSNGTQFTAPELVEALVYSDYDCTEEIAVALATAPDDLLIESLLTLVNSHEISWSRRNGLRVLGRLAEQADDTVAYTLVKNNHSEAIKQALLTRLELDRNEDVLNDAIWLADSYFDPFYAAQPYLQHITDEQSYHTSLRWRATAALSRLIASKERVDNSDINFLLTHLHSDDVWVRSQSARTLTMLEDKQIATEQRHHFLAALENSWRGEEELIAKVAIAEALDYYLDSTLKDELQFANEAINLNHTLTDGHITIRSGLPGQELPRFIQMMDRTEKLFFSLLGDDFIQPVLDDPTNTTTLYLFANRDAYQDYMNAFVGFGASSGGLYIEKDGRLYTYQRTSLESAYTVEHLLQHEYTHYLQGRYVYPDLWTDVNYHTEPKGWADEGLAEFMGLMAQDIHSEDGTHHVSNSRLETLCKASQQRDLAKLLERRAGYDDQGIFDYDYAWAFMHYLWTERRSVASNLFTSLRDETYKLEDFASIAQVSSIDELEADWHSAIDQWCRDW